MTLKDWIKQNWTGIGIFKAVRVRIIVRRPDTQEHGGETLVKTEFIPIEDAVDMFGDYKISRLDPVLDDRGNSPEFQFTVIRGMWPYDS